MHGVNSAYGGFTDYLRGGDGGACGDFHVVLWCGTLLTRQPEYDVAPSLLTHTVLASRVDRWLSTAGSSTPNAQRPPPSAHRPPPTAFPALHHTSFSTRHIPVPKEDIQVLTVCVVRACFHACTQASKQASKPTIRKPRPETHAQPKSKGTPKRPVYSTLSI